MSKATDGICTHREVTDRGGGRVLYYDAPPLPIPSWNLLAALAKRGKLPSVSQSVYSGIYSVIQSVSPVSQSVIQSVSTEGGW